VTEAELRTSDGVTARFCTPEEAAQRAEGYQEWLGRVTGKRPEGHELVRTPCERVNWTRLDKPLAESTVALVTTGGVHLRSQEPFDVWSEEGDWSSRPIPGDVDTADLTVTHTHYATQDALEDVNVMFPLDRLRELADEGIVGAVSSLHFGFMGFIPDPAGLVTDTAPAAAEQLRDRGVDIALLTAG
jgi:D-proline reductase (dithiol) PrdB